MCPNPRRGRRLAGVGLLAAVALTGCDNITRAFNPFGGTGTGAGSNVQVISVGGDAVDGRPRVEQAFPTGAGWPITVPIVVVFNESVNRDSVLPPTTVPGIPGQGTGEEEEEEIETAGVFLRDAQNQQEVPATYDFLLGDRVVLIRPTTPLVAATGYEVVVAPSLRDADGVRFGGTEPDVVADFLPDEDPSIVDGGIVTTLPLDTQRNVIRETPLYLIFTKPAQPATVDDGLQLRDDRGSVIAGGVTFPLDVAGVEDPRIARFDPSPAALEGDLQHEIVVDDRITFPGGGVLDFARTPFARFTTLPFTAPQSVTVGNALVGFPDKVNRQNLDALQIDVAVGASAAAGDTVLARIYGLDPETVSAEDDVNFVERSTALAASGAQTVSVSFSSALGSIDTPRFSDGALTLATQLTRGNVHSGFITSNPTNAPEQDTVVPTFTGAGSVANGVSTDLATDQESVVFFGRASERLGTAMLTAGGQMVELFASSRDGLFVLEPVGLNLRTTPLDYQLAITDVAGNLATTAFSGRILPRGVITDSGMAGTVVVEAYDEVTLAPIEGALVQLEPGAPAKPPSGHRLARTDATGQAEFSGVAVGANTVTIVAPGYGLRTLLETSATYVSLPLRPLTGATASLAGTAGFMPSVGQTALVGSNLLDDVASRAVQTATGDPTSIPTTAIRPQRLQLLTAFAGNFEPTGVPTFVSQACQMCGPSGMTATVPSGPVAAGETTTEAVALLPASLTRALSAPYTVDFSLAGGLDTANLVGTPSVRVMAGIRGMAGQSLFGVGLAQATAGAMYSVNGAHSLLGQGSVPGEPNLRPFVGSVMFVSTEAEDSSGNVSRHVRLAVTSTGVTAPGVTAPGIPNITPPAAASTGSPAVTFTDRLDISGISGVQGFFELIATDGAGRPWSLLRADDVGTGPVLVQLPDLGSVTGLATGTWTLEAQAHVFLTLTSRFSAAQFAFEELRGQQIGWARAASVDFTVN
ncbi:MAG: Ig-like domain-containing protein [Planctomycetota bacterium]